MSISMSRHLLGQMRRAMANAVDFHYPPRHLGFLQCLLIHCFLSFGADFAEIMANAAA